MSRIFISYKRVDKEKVFKIKDRIESSLGEKCWIDLDGIESDAQFMNVIIKAINNCEVFLFMYSKTHAQITDFEKDWTIRELNFATKKAKRIVFVNIDESPLSDVFEFMYGTKQQVDAMADNAMSKLCADLRTWLNITNLASHQAPFNSSFEGTNMHYELETYHILELGQAPSQEDALFPYHEDSRQQNRLFVLCDGMDEGLEGDVASTTVCEAMSQAILSRWNPTEPLTDELLLQAIDNAYNALDAKDNGEMSKIGTTMTFLCLHSKGATVAHIGNSRVYQFRPAKGNVPAQMMFKTSDHTYVNDLVRVGEITVTEANNHPQKNVLTRVMRPYPKCRDKADIIHLTDIQPGDCFFMCSDGMLEHASDADLLSIITKDKVAHEQNFEMLLDFMWQHENRNNYSAHIIYINNVISVPSKPLFQRFLELFR